MNGAAADTSAHAIELGAGHSRRLLEHAVRSGAEVSVLPHTRADSGPFVAAIVGCTPEGLLISSKADTVRDPASLISVYCEATVRLDSGRFLFSTNVIDARRSGDEVRLEIAKPAQLHVVQRRRFHRRDLRNKTPVRIVPLDRTDQPPLEATLLNVSTGGLACRIDQAGADRCCAERPVTLEFTIADCDDTFRMLAHLRRKTPGASAGRIILSLEFAAGAEAEREKLADALYGKLVALTDG